MEQTPLLRRLGNWLGVSASAEAGDADIESRTSQLAEESAQQLASQQLLDDVSAFLLQHRLPVNNETLAFAHDLITDSEPRLSGLVNRRLRENEPLTGEWIAEVLGKAANDDARVMSTLRQRLEKSITDFTRTTKDARTATSDYKTALRSHVDELDEVQHAGAVIQELATVAKAMLDRTQEIEAQMVRSERETKSLHRRLDEARRNAEMDHLTGLPNRRAFENLLDSEFAAARVSQDQLCVAFCDIDKFKLINDLHGHDAGDRVLKLVARTLSEISDDRCHVARHGGEEFVVLFRGKSIKEAFDTLDATRDALAARRLVNRANDTPFGQVSFSGGIADIFAHRDPRAALKAADEALYAAKAQGRNRIVIAGNSTAVLAA